MENPAISNNNPLLQNDEVAELQKTKRKSTRMLKDDFVAENERLKIKLHELETWIKNFRQMPTMRRVIFAATINPKESK